MFAGTVEPGWHDPMLPVAYVIGALLAGVSVTAALVAVVRFVLPLQGLITERHFNLLALLILVLAVLNFYCNCASFGGTALFGTSYEQAVLHRRFAGPHAWAGWCSVLVTLLPPLLFCVPALRRSMLLVGVIGVLVAFGIWADHFMLIVTTLQHDFLPSASHWYAMTLMGLATFAGTAGLFLFLFLLVLRYVPVISLTSLRWLQPAYRRG